MKQKTNPKDQALTPTVPASEADAEFEQALARALKAWLDEEAELAAQLGEALSKGFD